MGTNKEQLNYDTEESRSHSTTPEGYFETLEERIMAHIDDEPVVLE